MNICRGPNFEHVTDFTLNQILAECGQDILHDFSDQVFIVTNADAPLRRSHREPSILIYHLKFQ